MWTETLVDDLLALDEPWRGRFLAYLADQATAGSWNGGEEEPDRQTLVQWLTMDLELRRRITLMLATWRRPRLDRAIDPRTNVVITAGPEAPEQALCPACREEVEIRHRSDSGTWFYRHRAGGNGHCPRRTRRPGE